VRPATPARRIVCLVPSLTEALFSLGLDDRLVGITEWCVHPSEGVARLPRVGGTKDPDLGAVRELAPDLVIANHEENRRQDVEALERSGLAVWVTYPRTVADGVALLRELAEIGAEPAAFRQVVEPVEAAYRDARTQPPAGTSRVFCPIWKDPWMAVGPDTYADDLLRLCGGANVFANLAGSRGGRRYPKIREAEIVAAAPEVVLLPDEPYAFGPGDARELAALPIPAAVSGRIHRIDGTLVSWYGPRIRRALETLRTLLCPPGRSATQRGETTTQ
jgi:ABC-type hemin transport system substrate-binding protein